MQFVYDDGGRKAAGYDGKAGDCVCRAIAIATDREYGLVYKSLNAWSGLEKQRAGRSKSSSRSGIYRTTYQRYLEANGWKWTPTMAIGTGCKVHLADGELPMGRIIARLSKHLTAVIDGVIHDTHDPQRNIAYFEQDTGRELKPGEQRNHNGIFHIGRRCVYGYYSKLS